MPNDPPGDGDISAYSTPIRRGLQRAARAVADAGAHPAPISETAARELAAAREAGLLALEDSAVAFGEYGLLIEALLVHLSEAVAARWEDVEATALSLQEAFRLRYQLKLGEDFERRLLLRLHRVHGLDLLTRLEEAAKHGNDEGRNEPFWSLYGDFCSVLPDLDLDPEALALQLPGVMEAASGDLTYGQLFGAVERLAARSRTHAERLVAAFLKQSDLRSVEFTANALKALGAFDLDAAHARALALTHEKTPVLRRVGIAALGWFDYVRQGSAEGDHRLNEALLKATNDRLVALSRDPDASVRAVVTQALGSLLEDPAGDSRVEMESTFVALASDDAPEVQYSASEVLRRQTQRAVDVAWFWEGLRCLSGVPAAHRGILHNLDLAIWTTVEQDPKEALAFLRAVVTSRPYGQEGEKDGLPDLLKSTVRRLMQEYQAPFEAELTRWFASLDLRLHAAAADVVAEFTVRAGSGRGRIIRLDVSALKAPDEHAVRRIVFAVIGHVTGGEPIASLLASVLWWDDLDARTGGLVASALADAALYNYPGGAGDYLRSLTVRTDTPQAAYDVIAHALNRSEGYYAALRERPHRKELAPPDRRLHRLRTVEVRRRRRLSEVVDEESTILSLVHKVPLKHGRSWFYEQEGHLTTPSQLGHFSTEFELPRGLLIDPLGQAMNRVAWRGQATLSDPLDVVRLNDDRSHEGPDPAER